MEQSQGARASVQALANCSTEKVNHSNCMFRIDRRYPVTFPTLQMAHGKQVFVVVTNPMPFETLTLDEMSATLLPGTDQAAALVPLAIPQLAGFTWSNETIPVTSNVKIQELEGVKPPEGIEDSPAVDAQLEKLDKALDAAEQKRRGFDLPTLRGQVLGIYAQLSQVLSPLPQRALLQPDVELPKLSPNDPPWPCSMRRPNEPLPGLVPLYTPNPWDCYRDWRAWLKCEIAGGCTIEIPQPRPSDPKSPDYWHWRPPSNPPFADVLDRVGTILVGLPSGTTQSAKPIFDQAKFDKDVTETKGLIAELSDDQQKWYAPQLQNRVGRENGIVTWEALLSNGLTAIQKDFMNYYQNIELADGAPVPLSPTAEELAGGAPADSAALGIIFDPRYNKQSSPYPKFLGRQAVFSMNAVNQISTGRASVTTSAAKTSLATITVIYADPIFEGSAGVIFSFVHNRTYSNQTVGAKPTNPNLQQGEVIIQETKPEPEIIPFVAGNWRIGHDFTYGPNGRGRRGAFYGTAYVGVNPNTKLPEYGGGPSLSWRSILLSAFYERVHDTRLVSPQTVGGTVCLPAANSNPPACSSTPTAPISQPFATNAFGIGLSVRVPTTFTAGTGGVSH